MGIALCVLAYALTGVATSALVQIQWKGKPDCRFYALVGLYCWPVVWAFWVAFGAVLLGVLVLIPLISLSKTKKDRK